MTLQKVPSRFAVILLISTMLFGCAQPKKMVRFDYEQRVRQMRTAGIFTPEIDYYDLTFGGTTERNAVWSKQASQNIVEAISAELSARGFEVKTIEREGELKQSMEEIEGLFNAIAVSHRNHVLWARPIDVFPHKAASFDYSVGPIEDILAAYHVDALVLVDGSGAGNSIIEMGGVAIAIALIDRTGALLWYEPYVEREAAFKKRDIRDRDTVKAIIGRMFEKMPAVPK